MGNESLRENKKYGAVSSLQTTNQNIKPVSMERSDCLAGTLKARTLSFSFLYTSVSNSYNSNDNSVPRADHVVALC